MTNSRSERNSATTRMKAWSIPPGEVERSFARAIQLRLELERKERALGRKVQILAKGIASLMAPGTSHHRKGIGLHAFDVDGTMCVASSYLEPNDDDYRYRYAILCGGEPARAALRTAKLDPGDSDEPGSGRRIRIATNADYDDFIERLPRYLADIGRDLEARAQRIDLGSDRLRQAR